MSNSEPPPTIERLRRERDLYLGLLGLGAVTDPRSFLTNALGLVVGIVGADRGYLELFDAEKEGQPFFCQAGFPEDQVGRVRKLVSQGIIAEAVASGTVVVTPSAVLDPRFRDLASVRLSNIDAVLCAPIGRDPPSGVLYLEGRRDSPMFSKDCLAQVDLFTQHLPPLVGRVLQQRRQAAEDPTEGPRARLNAHDFVGRGPALAGLLREAEIVVPLDVGVLLSGDTGTGKTQLARLIHRNSPRASGPFVELNCAALPEQLVESELFGALPGAHSTATRRVEGKVAAAQGGTLLLDEVGELPLRVQAKLLQLLQDKEYFPLGAARAERADVRVIAATNLDLKQAVEERRFREDLYYRLQVVAIRVPALSERPEDCVPLATHFCERAIRAHELSRVELSPAALRAVESTEWPGNVRQLAHTVEAGVIRASAEGARQVEVRHLFPEGASTATHPLTFQEETRRFQAQLVGRVLEAADWNVSAASRQLDLTRAHLYNLIKSFGLSRKRR